MSPLSGSSPCAIMQTASALAGSARKPTNDPTNMRNTVKRLTEVDHLSCTRCMLLPIRRPDRQTSTDRLRVAAKASRSPPPQPPLHGRLLNPRSRTQLDNLLDRSRSLAPQSELIGVSAGQRRRRRPPSTQHLGQSSSPQPQCPQGLVRRRDRSHQTNQIEPPARSRSLLQSADRQRPCWSFREQWSWWCSRWWSCSPLPSERSSPPVWRCTTPPSAHTSAPNQPGARAPLRSPCPLNHRGRPFSQPTALHNDTTRHAGLHSRRANLTHSGRAAIQ